MDWAAPIPLTIGLAGAAGAGGLGIFARGMFHPRSRLLCPVISSGPRSERTRIALTFDDGPCPGSTDRVLDVLERSGVRATFFVIGRYAHEHPSLIARAHAAGHLIGNHTYDHHRSGMFGWKRYWMDQIARADEAVGAVVGAAPRLFRPPMGFKSHHLGAAVRRLGHTVVTWSRRGMDGVATTENRIARAMLPVRGGDIVLLHDGRDPASRRDASVTARALPQILADLQSRGLQPVRLDELLRLG